jgi:hypothetical protein
MEALPPSAVSSTKKALSIASRQVIGFSAVLSLMVLLTVIATLQVSKINSSLGTIIDVNSVKQRHAIDFRGSVHDRAIAIRDVVLIQDPAQLNATLDTIDRLAQAYTQAATKLDALFQDAAMVTAQDRELLQAIKAVEARTLPLATGPPGLCRLAGQHQRLYRPAGKQKPSDLKPHPRSGRRIPAADDQPMRRRPGHRRRLCLVEHRVRAAAARRHIGHAPPGPRRPRR